MEKQKQEVEWYDNPNIILNVLTMLIIVIIVLSQAFAITNKLATVDILRSLLNHNSVYILTLVYFVFLRTSVGKKYFNFLNVILILLYTFIVIGSLLTIFQSFGLGSLTLLCLNLILLLYLINTFLRDTRFWSELKLSKVPFDEVNNDWYFYTILILASLNLSVNLIEATTFDGIVISMFECIYMILFSRYIYLYKAYMENREKIKNAKKKKIGVDK